MLYKWPVRQGSISHKAHVSHLPSNVPTSSSFDDWFTDLLEAFESIEGDSLYPSSLPKELCDKSSTSPTRGIVTFKCTPFTSSKFYYIRRVSFKTLSTTTDPPVSTCNVFNFVAFPRLDYDLPVFGVDIVVLPGGCLAAIDFQPLYDFGSPFRDNSVSFKPLVEAFEKWSPHFPPGGDLPVDALKFFSPRVLWTKIRFPEKETMAKLREALKDYTSAYLVLVNSVATSTNTSTLQIQEDIEEKL